MWYIIVKKIVSAIISVIGITFGIFLLLKSSNIHSLDDILFSEAAQSETGLMTQYTNYLFNILQGHWGYSIVNHQSIIQEALSLIPATVELTLFATLFALIFGILAGTLAAIFRHTFLDYLVLLLSFVGYSVPIFWWGLITMLVVSLDWGLTPVSGRIGFLFDIEPVTGFMLVDLYLGDFPNKWEALKSILHHLLLPAIVLATVPFSIISRTIRASMIEVLKKEYVQAAFSRGLSSFRIYWVHAARNALALSTPIIGMQIGALVMGAIITEAIFSWPGLGKWLIESVSRRDFPAIHGGIIMLIFIIIIINSLIDMLNVMINPKLRRM